MNVAELADHHTYHEELRRVWVATRAALFDGLESPDGPAPFELTGRPDVMLGDYDQIAQAFGYKLWMVAYPNGDSVPELHFKINDHSDCTED